jgi:hypothetical protein
MACEVDHWNASCSSGYQVTLGLGTYQRQQLPALRRARCVVPSSRRNGIESLPAHKGPVDQALN